MMFESYMGHYLTLRVVQFVVKAIPYCHEKYFYKGEIHSLFTVTYISYYRKQKCFFSSHVQHSFRPASTDL